MHSEYGQLAVGGVEPATAVLPGQGRGIQRGRRAGAYIDQVIANLATAAPGGRNAALNHAAWLLGRWIGAGAPEQSAVEVALFFATERNGLVAEDRPHRYWATIRSGLSAGVQDPIDLDTERAEH